MSFFGMCQSDPFLDFIRKTYEAVPLKYPEARAIPLGVLAVAKHDIRFMGKLGHLTDSGSWNEPHADTTDLPDISGKVSSRVAWQGALDLLSPFLSEMFEIGKDKVSAGLTGGRDVSNGIRISLARTQRNFIAPFVCARQFSTSTFRIPREFLAEFREGNRTLYLIDSVLTAREIELNIEGETATDMASKLEASLAGKVSAKLLSRSKSTLTITGTKRAPFAFTCLELTVREDGTIDGLKVPRHGGRLGAMGALASTTIPHASLGEHNEFIVFDA
jgi:hypothetical protein